MTVPLKIWGYTTWKFLHTFAQSYSGNNRNKTQKKAIKNFLNNLDAFLPCSICQKHCKGVMNKTNMQNAIDEAIESKTNEKMVNLIIFLHNEVNSTCGKPMYNAQKSKRLHSNLVYGQPAHTDIAKILAIGFSLLVLLSLIYIFVLKK